jgi:hypothetical protein
MPSALLKNSLLKRLRGIFIDAEEFVVDLFVIPLEGFDMVLGV